jgi:hypothetical protein
MAGVPAVGFDEALILQVMARNFHRLYGIFIDCPLNFHSPAFSLRA